MVKSGVAKAIGVGGLKMGRLQASAARASSAADRGNMRLAFIPLLRSIYSFDVLTICLKVLENFQS
jgi:hypothetical protein